MSLMQQRQSIQAELAGLKKLLESSPEDILGTPLLRGRIEELEKSLAQLEERPPITPEAELFFTAGPTVGSQGLEAKFAAAILGSFQDMLTNHHSAKYYGAPHRTGPRRRESETKLYLTALPRGSFGLQLSQPAVTDFFAASQVVSALQDINDLVEAAGQSDEAFDKLLAGFHPRVLIPLQRFIETLHNGGGSCRIVTGLKETVLTDSKITEAFQRVISASQKEDTKQMEGVFGGVLLFSWEFEFQLTSGSIIKGLVADKISEEMASDWNQRLSHKRVIATVKETIIATRSGPKKPNYELQDLKAEETAGS